MKSSTVFFKVDGTETSSMHFDGTGGGYDSSTVSAVVQGTNGQRVWTECAGATNIHANPARTYNTFSGTLVQEITDFYDL